MAIKVKHEGSAASRIAAAEQGGAAKRAMEAAALVKPTPIQTLAPAHASAPGIGGVHAQLISAPGGGAHAPLIGGGGGIGAHARMGGGGGRGGGAGSRVSTAGGGGGDLDYKVTGTSIFDRPDDESEWDPTHGGRWVRKWLPGEKEAEALGRVGAVKNQQEKKMLDYRHQLGMESAEQGSLLATERDINNARLKALLIPNAKPASIRSPFPNADGNSELQKQFNDIMSAVKDSVDSAKSKGVTISPQQQKADGDTLRSIVDSVSANGAGTQPAPGDEIGNLYANGGSVFGEAVGESDRSPIQWLRPQGEVSADGGDSSAIDEYASSIGGLINALMRV